MLVVRLLNLGDSTKYENLQRQCLTHQKDFIAREESFRWYAFMNQFPALGVFENDELISVLRLEWHNNWTSLNHQMQSNLTFDPIQFPVGYICKVATHPQKMKLGLNGLLRFHAIKICQAFNVQFLFGTMIKGSARVKSMLEMGYLSIENPKRWSGYYQSSTPALICYLDLKDRGQFALDYLQSKHRELFVNSVCEIEHQRVAFLGKNGAA